MARKLWSTHVAFVVTLCSSGPVLARAPIYPDSSAVAVDYSQSVAQRPIDMYEGNAAKLGSWFLYPEIDLEETYDDNVYATKTDRQSDLISTLRGQARLESNWELHEIRLEAGGELGAYTDLTDENYQDYYLKNNNRFDIIYGTSLIADMLYKHSHAARTSPDNITSAVDPLVYDTVAGTLGVERNLGLLTLRIDGKVEAIEYEDSKRADGSRIDNTGRNFAVLDTGVQLSYQPSPASKAYVSARVKEISYEDRSDSSALDRDSSGIELIFGLNKAISDLWVMDLYAGYAPSDLADSTLKDISGSEAVVLGAKLLWNPTPLTSVIGNLSRKAFQTTEANSSALITTAALLRLEHKLTRSILLDADFGASYGEYYGSARTDRGYRFGFGAEYYFAKLVSLRAGYDYVERDSDYSSQNYDKHTVSLEVRLNY